MKPVLRLAFACDNDAFQSPNPAAEIASVLRTLAEKIEAGWLDEVPGKYRNVHDINGNIIGTIRFAREE